ncbi:MAG: tetratricopeptide repeat protein [Terriglobales bacterium]|jgi:tetratricopeptide (TPR) repeat protein
MLSRRLLVSLLLLLVPCCSAQIGNQGQAGNVKVRVVFSNGRGCRSPVRLVLMLSASSTPVAQTYTNDECMASFEDLAVGTYHAIVSGEDIVETDSGLFEVDSRKSSQFLYITVKTKEEANQGTAQRPTGPTVAAVDLNVPDKAKREFDKASDFIAQQDWKKAQDRLNKALAIYPKYAAAHYNLGIVFGHLGDRTQERAALQKAISINDHFPQAYVSLGKMAIVDRNFPEAEDFLNKAIALDPNTQTLVLLANVELMDQHYDEAIANCRKAHATPQDPHALVHYIAARALEHENDLKDAIAELQTFLQEEPSGPRADAVRKELAELQSQAH